MYVCTTADKSVNPGIFWLLNHQIHFLCLFSGFSLDWLWTLFRFLNDNRGWWRWFWLLHLSDHTHKYKFTIFIPGKSPILWILRSSKSYIFSNIISQLGTRYNFISIHISITIKTSQKIKSKDAYALIRKVNYLLIFAPGGYCNPCFPRCKL